MNLQKCQVRRNERELWNQGIILKLSDLTFVLRQKGLETKNASNHLKIIICSNSTC